MPIKVTYRGTFEFVINHSGIELPVDKEFAEEDTIKTFFKQKEMIEDKTFFSLQATEGPIIEVGEE